MRMLLRALCIVACSGACFPLYPYKARSVDGGTGSTGTTGGTGTIIDDTPALAISLEQTTIDLLSSDRVGLSVTVTRPQSLAGAVTLSVANLPAGVSVEIPDLPAGTSLGRLVFVTAAVAATPATTVTITAAMTGASNASAPVTMTIGNGKRVTVSPASVRLVRGSPLSFTATLARDSGFSGVATVEVIGATADFTGATSATLAAGSTIQPFNFATGGAQVPAQVDLRVRVTHAGLALPDETVSVDLRPLPGSPDTSFGTNGARQDTIGNVMAAPVQAIVTAGDAVLVLATTYATPPGDVTEREVAVVMRYNVTGAPQIIAQLAISTPSERPLFAKAMRLDGSGRILVLGETDVVGGFRSLYVARLLTNGALDDSFGTNGAVLLSTLPGPLGPPLGPCSAGSIFVRGGQVIVLAKATDNAASCSSPGSIRTVLFAFDDTGTMVPGYDSAGAHDVYAVHTEGGSYDQTLDGGAENGSGEIVALGGSIRSGSNTMALASRFDTLVPPAIAVNSFAAVSFSTSGANGADVLRGATAATAGSWYAVGSATRTTWAVEHALVARIKSDGVLDGTFASSGVLHFVPGIAASEGRLAAVITDAMNRAIACGTLVDSLAAKRMVATRLTPSGTVDDAFGSQGYFVVTPSAGDLEGRAMAIDSKLRVWIFGGQPAAGNVYAARLFSE